MPGPSTKIIAKAIFDGLGGDLKFISGKWFYKNDEVENLYKFIDEVSETRNDLSRWCECISSLNKFKEFENIYIRLYGNSEKWPEPPIIREARALSEKDLKSPPKNIFDEKQLAIISYLIRHDEEKCIIITGIGGSGKSTFGNIICQLFGDVGHASLSDLSNRFSLEEAIKHRLVYSDELDSEQLNNGVLKTLFSNQKIQVQAKGKDPYTTKCQSAFIFCCNTPPRIDLDDTGLLRRIVYYSMNKKIKNPDTSLNKFQYSHDDLVNIAAWAILFDKKNILDGFRDETRFNLMKNNSVYMLKGYSDYRDYAFQCGVKGLKPYSEPKWQNIRNLIKEWRSESEFDPLETL